MGLAPAVLRRLLKMHRESAATGEGAATIDEAECEEARERILARLERIRERALEDGVFASPAPGPSAEMEGRSGA